MKINLHKQPNILHGVFSLKKNLGINEDCIYHMVISLDSEIVEDRFKK